MSPAEAESTKDLERVLPAAAFVDTAVGELSSSEVLADQVAHFLRAGFNFFRSTPEFADLSLADRRDAGGSSNVRRVLRSESSILLETPCLIVGFVKGVSEADRAEVLERYRLVLVRELNFADSMHCMAPGRATLEICLKLMDEDAVEYAEPDFVEVLSTRYEPNDNQFDKQWHHRLLKSETAWDVVRGSDIRIAVIDNGFYADHPDLNLDAVLSGWYRPVTDCCDADFFRGLKGMPKREHGTACAGMAAATGDNHIGGCGVAFESGLAAVACAEDQISTQLTLARAIAYLVQPSLEVPHNPPAPADVISCSLGSRFARWEMRQILSDAIDFAAKKGRDCLGTPLFWASTNKDSPISEDEVCSHPETIVVGASTYRDEHSGTGYGPELDFLAPGVGVWLPISGGGYQFVYGTSFAAPCAAAVGALTLAKYGSLNAHQLRDRLREKACKVGSLSYGKAGRNDRFGYGRVNALASVS